MFQQIPPEMRVRYGRLDQICRTSRELCPTLVDLADICSGDARPSRRPGAGLSPATACRAVSLRLPAYYDPEKIKREVAELKRTLISEPVKVQEINRGRIEILGKRVEKFCKIKENSEVIHAQCAAIEDVLQLIRDQS